MRKLNIAVTGYFGTGSSAVIDLLREYKDVVVVPEIGRLYEHEIFYYPGGLFDLCTLLTHGNTPQGSDIYINRFFETMHRLNDYDYLWYGSYKKMFGDKVMRMTEEFVNSISEKRDGTNSYHYLKTRFDPVKAIKQIGASFLYKKKFVKYGVGYVNDRRPVYFSMPTEEELYSAAQKFTISYFDLFGKDGQISVYDHLIWPQQVNTHKRCFSDNLKIIVVNRDPRDVFLSSKYVWCKPGIGNSIGKPHFGEDPIKFIDEWKRTVVLENENPNALHIYFEDLIYKYDETVATIEQFLGIPSEMHLHPKEKFNPLKSIENTQVFNMSKDKSEEAKPIEKYLSNYLYPFPYVRESNLNKMFDSPNS